MTEQLVIDILKIIIPSLFSFAFGIIVTILFLRNPKVRHLSFVSKLFTLQAEKFREIIKNDYNITKLEIVDEDGKKVSRPYPMTNGLHKFRCLATYTDGSQGFFSPYWLCFEKGGNSGTDVLGDWKQGEIVLSHSSNHARYTELSCWIFPPSRTQSNSHICRDSTGFKYE